MLIIGLIALTAYIIILYFIDITQTKHAIRKNYPVIGRFRYFFEHLGEFFRQYFFSMDREEMPFNRAQRSWVYRAAKGLNNTVAFGSTRDIRKPGTVLFVNSPYPTLGEINKKVVGAYFSPKIFSEKVRKGLKYFFQLKGRACG